MYDEVVLFLVFMQEIGHLQAIGVSLSEQSRLFRLITEESSGTYPNGFGYFLPIR